MPDEVRLDGSGIKSCSAAGTSGTTKIEHHPSASQQEIRDRVRVAHRPDARGVTENFCHYLGRQGLPPGAQRRETTVVLKEDLSAKIPTSFSSSELLGPQRRSKGPVYNSCKLSTPT